MSFRLVLREMFTRVVVAFVVLRLSRGESPEVALPQGHLVGTISETINKRQIFAFLGIPYAQPPVDDLRFKDPREPLPWLGTMEATVKSPMCIQWDPTGTVYGSEDCLYLSVYTPKLKTDGKLMAVVVYIHGGGFTIGYEGLYGPEYLLDNDIVLVTINYRLGALGFLSTEDEVVPGNLGLKDQTLALKWVNKNIASFGGNPNEVTIAGWSAGSVSVHLHILSPLSRGLFSKALMFSGSIMCPWSIRRNPRSKAEFLASKLGCPTEDSQAMVDCIKTKPAETITDHFKDFERYTYVPFGLWGPVVEPSSPGAFLDKRPIDIIKDGEAADVPSIYSVTSDEGLTPASVPLTNDTLRLELETNWYKNMPLLLDYKDKAPPSKLDDVTRAITKHYFDSDGPIDIRNHKKEFVKMVSDKLFIGCTGEAAKLHAYLYDSPIYFYKFSHIGKKRIFNSIETVFEGTDHGEDMTYILQYSPVRVHDDASSWPMIKKMTSIWTEFSSKGAVQPKWTSVKDGLPSLTYLEIIDDQTEEMRSESNFGDVQFWKSLNLSDNLS